MDTGMKSFVHIAIVCVLAGICVLLGASPVMPLYGIIGYALGGAIEELLTMV